MVFGSFDILHPGHTEFLKEAKKLGTHLTVVLAKDHSIEKIKGHHPHFSEEERIAQMKALRFVDEVLLGDDNDYYKVPKEKQPQIIALGYDQKIPLPLDKGGMGDFSPPQRGMEEGVTTSLKEFSLLNEILPNTKIIRLQAHYPEKFKSSYFR